MCHLVLRVCMPLTELQGRNGRGRGETDGHLLVTPIELRGTQLPDTNRCQADIAPTSEAEQESKPPATSRGVASGPPYTQSRHDRDYDADHVCFVHPDPVRVPPGQQPS